MFSYIAIDYGLSFTGVRMQLSRRLDIKAPGKDNLPFGELWSWFFDSAHANV